MGRRPKSSTKGGPISGSEWGIGVIRNADGTPAREYTKRELWLDELLTKSNRGTPEDFKTYIDALQGKIDPPS